MKAASFHIGLNHLLAGDLGRGLPFYGITLLAGLQTISPELYEAATIDGATTWHRFRYVTLPLLRPVILIVIGLLTLVSRATRSGPTAGGVA